MRLGISKSNVNTYINNIRGAEQLAALACLCRCITVHSVVSFNFAVNTWSRSDFQFSFVCCNYNPRGALTYDAGYAQVFVASSEVDTNDGSKKRRKTCTSRTAVVVHGATNSGYVTQSGNSCTFIVSLCFIHQNLDMPTLISHLGLSSFLETM